MKTFKTPTTVRRKGPPLFLFLLLLLLLIKDASARQQYFRVRPQDVSVAEGGTAVVNCEVGNREGRVQWTKDGLTLGYDRSIPGIPRYSVLGSDNSGQFSLSISNVSLADDADFECQVGPANYNKPIRASAHINVLLAPTSIEMTGYVAGQRIDINENEELELTCKVANSKPKATIVWYKNDVRFNVESPPEVTEEDGSIVGRKTVKSKIKFRPTARENQASVTCEAQHPALAAAAAPMRFAVLLSVQYPPGPPEIQGYEGETIRLGQTVTLTCVSHGGNPLAEIVWYKNNAVIDFSYTSSGRESKNMYNFVAATDDNKARYKCEAKNHRSPEPMAAEIVMDVQFAPDKVTITGPTEAKNGDTLKFECLTGNSNPPASIRWLVDGVEVSEPFTHSETSPNGGWVTKSELTVSISPADRNKMIHCYAVNAELGETIQETHVVSVLYPPGTPNITGLTYGAVLEEGQQKRLTCISMAGNPLADLTWFRGDVKVEGTTTVKNEGDYSKSELTIVANRTDNDLPYRCEASNPATAAPKTASVRLSVLFKPSKVTITVDPESPKAGRRAVLKCESGSSNPTSSIVWRYGGKRLEGAARSVRAGENGGNITVNLLEVEITPEHHGAVFICEARNPALHQSVHDAKTLSVKYKPQFPEDVSEDAGTLKVYTVEEGKSLLIDLTAKGNPAEIEYKWSNPDRMNIPQEGESLPDGRFNAEQGKLNITAAKREDKGKYKVKASNEEGKTVAKFMLDVQYGPSITEMTDSVTVRVGENAEFFCSVDSNPIVATSISWKREGFDMEKRTVTTFSNVTKALYLYVKEVKAEDSGVFTCVANNGVGTAVQNTTYLLVRNKPQIDESPALAKSASDKGLTGTLTCRAKGAPKIEFAWSREGSVLDPATSAGKYEVKGQMIDRLTWESQLLVKNVTSKDYGKYDCIARNEEGLDRFTIALNVTSRPDSPAYLRVLNLTYTSVTLSWTPGFDGGFEQSYRIRYRKDDDPNFHYVDVPAGVNIFEVQDLKVGTKYAFAIMSINVEGESEYTADIEGVETKSPVPVTEDDMNVNRGFFSRGLILTVTLVATTLIILHAIAISCYIKRRGARKQPIGGSSSGSTKSATIEMYVGSSYGGNDTISGETLSSLSEKSGSYTSSGNGNGVGGGGGGEHHRHMLHRQHLPKPQEEDDDDLDDFDEDPIPHATVAASTYLTDTNGLYGSRAVGGGGGGIPNYATMPRRPVNGSFGHHDSQQRYTNRDDLRRQAYMQSLGDSHDIYVPSVASADSFPPPPPLGTGKITPLSNYGDYNGLYVPPAEEFLPPRPPLPSSSHMEYSVSHTEYSTTRYSEEDGHLV